MITRNAFGAERRVNARSSKRRMELLRKKRDRFRRLQIEQLEDRHLLSATRGLFPLAESSAAGIGGMSALGDLNRDGITDVVSVGAPQSDPEAEDRATVSVLLGDGDGMFDLLTSYPIGSGVSCVALGDFNGDGHSDVVIGGNSGAYPDYVGTLSIFQGNGDGTLAAGMAYETTGVPESLSLGDLDGDGAIDIVTVNSDWYSNESTVSILMNDGNGTFAELGSRDIGEDENGLALGDLNADGRLDVVIATSVHYPDYEGAVSVALGNGDGTFGDTTNYSAPGPVVSLGVGDVNGDGKLDVVASCWRPPAADSWESALLVFAGNGDGSLVGPAAMEGVAAAEILGLEDLNGDGALDLITWSWEAAHVLLGGGDGTFQMHASYATRGAWGPSLGDVNGDGADDILMHGYDTVFTIFGNGDGTFNAPPTYGHAASAYAMTVGDLNGDGVLDLVTADNVYDYDNFYGAYGQSVTLWIGRPDGSFAYAESFDTRSFPESLALDDLNGDGHLDLVTLNSPAPEATASVLLGRGDGTLADPVTYTVGGSGGPLFLDDVNGDGHVDLVAGNPTLLPGNGDGTFGAPVELGTDSFQNVCAVGDTNGDNRPDLIGVDDRTHKVSVRLAQAGGTFGDPVLSALAAPASTTALVDLDGDGVLDLIMAQPGTEMLSVMLGNGNGTFAEGSAFRVDSEPWYLAAGDVNRDDIPDVITSNPQDRSVTVLLGRGDGNLSSPDRFDLDGTPGPLSLGDFNGDAIADVALIESISEPTYDRPALTSVSVMLNHGDGTLLPKASYPTGFWPADVSWADMNSDGHLDLVSAGPNVGILFGDQMAEYSRWTILHAPFASCVAVDDLNADGQLDVVTGNSNGSVSVLLGRGEGLFDREVTYTTSIAADSVLLADFTADGVLDVVVTPEEWGTDGALAVVLSGNGDGTLASPLTFSTTDPLALGDLNGDGFLDVVAATTTAYGDQESSLSVALNNGDGTLADPISYGVDDYARAVAVADFNGDTKLDVALTVADWHWIDQEDKVLVFLGNGDGTLGDPAAYATREYPEDIQVGDVNRDGVPDIVTANEGVGDVSVLLGVGDGTFHGQTMYAVGVGVGSVALGDANGDGLLDLATADGSGHVTVLKNLLGISHTPRGRTSGPVQAIQIHFPREMNTSSFSIGEDSVSFTGPSGNPLTMASYSWPDSQTLQIEFAPQTTPGSYELTIGPDVLDVDGIAINVDGDRVAGEIPDDWYLAAFDIAGPKIAACVAEGAPTGPVESLFLRFDHPMDQVSLDTGDVAITGPGGAVQATGINWLDSQTARVMFTPQTTAGQYQAKVGPDILDIAGNALDLDGDVLGGELPDDQHTCNFVITAPHITQHEPDSTMIGPIQNVRFHFDHAMDPTSFTLADDIAAFTGPGGTITATGYTWTDAQSLEVAFDPQYLPGDYQMTISPDILSVTGNLLDQDYDLTAGEIPDDRYVATFTITAPPQIVGHSPSETVFPSVESIRVDFDRPMDQGSFSLEHDVIAFTGPNGSIEPSEFDWLDSQTLAIAFSKQSAEGDYRMTLGPNILDTGGSALDGDGDYRAGELAEDLYAATFSITTRNLHGLFPGEVFAADNAYHVALGDVNGDGLSDAIAAAYYNDAVSVLLGNGDGSFSDAVNYAVGDYPQDVSVGDVNGDGRLDIVTANTNDDTVSVLLGNGDGTFAVQAAYDVGNYPVAISLGDLDGDGAMEIVAANRYDDTVSVLPGNGDGTFGAQSALAVGNDPRDVSVADLDGDGALDVVAGTYYDGVSVLLGHGDGTFADQVAHASGGFLSLAMGDVSGDGTPDIVASNTRYGYDVSVLIGNGDGSFADEVTYDVGSSPNSVSTSDLNGDGAVDVVTGTSMGVSVLLGLGDGTFADHVTYEIGYMGARSVALGDLSGDQWIDIVVGGSSGANLLVLTGNGDGTFADRQTYEIAPAPTSVLDCDLNSDGFQDIVALHQRGLLLLDGNGDGTLTPAPEVILERTPWIVAGGDLNGDGTDDLAVANRGDNSVSILLGGNTGFTQHSAYSVGMSPSAIVLADLDGNGMRDVVTANEDGDDVSVLLGNGDGSFGVQATYVVGDAPVDLHVSDVTGDDVPDIVTANRNGRNVSVLAGTGDGTFADQMTFDAQSGLRAVAPVDLNGDQHPDIVTAHDSSNGFIAVRMNNGDGTFAAAVNFVVDTSQDALSYPRSMAVGDVNGDGDLDVVTANMTSAFLPGTWTAITYGSASVLLGDGDGTLAAPVVYRAGREPSDVSLDDVTGDGKLDIVTDGLSLLSGKGDGTFSDAIVRDGSFQSISLGDFNGDRLLDLGTVNVEDFNASVFWGQASGTFFDRASATVGRSARPAVLGDLNGDSVPDMVIPNSTDNNVSVLLGAGHGNFADPATYAVGNEPWTACLGDLNEDGKLDIVTANESSDNVSVLLNNGDGTFAAHVTYDVGAGPLSLALGDTDGDGHLDAVVTNDDDGTISILRGAGDGTLATQFVLDVGSSPFPVVLDDFNADGRQDIAVANRQQSRVSVLMGAGDGTFAPPVTYSVGSRPESLTVGDLNGDGAGDLVAANLNNDTVSVLLGYGDGTFAPHVTYEAGGAPVAVSLGDVNVDGTLDIVTADRYGDDTVSVLPGNGDGTFGEKIGLSVGRAAMGVSLGDMNGDEFADFVVVVDGQGYYSSPDEVQVRFGRGNGTWWTEQQLPIGVSHPIDAALADFNADGHVDIATVNQNTDNLSVLLGAGDGSFADQVLYPVGDWPQSVAAADLNGDGVPDLVTADADDNTVSVLLANDDGTFADRIAYPARPNVTAVAIGDLNGDGAADIATADLWDDSVSVFLGAGDGTFADAVTWSLGNSPTALAIGDVNGDSATDIVAAGSSPGSVSILLNQGDATFADPHTISVGDFSGWGASGPEDVALADLNGDGLVDIAVATATSNGDPAYVASVLLGNGDGSFSDPVSFGVGQQPLALTTTDLNGDGGVEIVTADASFGITVLPNLRRIEHLPGGRIVGPVDAVQFQFVNQMDQTSFAIVDDIVTFVGPQGPLAAQGYSWLDGQTLQVTFAAQSVPGRYRMDIGPQILDVGGRPMEVNRNSTPGETPGDQYVASWTIVPPRIVAHAPKGERTGPVERVRLSFDQPMDMTSFSPDDDIVSFIGPQGNVSPTGSRWLDDRTLELAVDLRAAGEYELLMGTEILNTAGNGIDLDGDFLTGEQPDDQYLAEFTIKPPRIVGHSPVGILSDAVERIQLSFDQPMDPTSFSPQDDIASFLGPDGAIEATGFTWGDANTLEISFDSQTRAGGYQLVLGAQILNTVGNALDQDGDYVIGEVPDDQYEVAFGIRAPQIVYASVPEGLPGGPIEKVRFVFDLPMDQTSFALTDDVVSFAGPQGAVTPTGFNWLDEQMLEVRFGAQTAPGPYQMVVGPQILSTLGNALNLDGDLVAGETPDDQYTMPFGIVAPRVVTHIPGGTATPPVSSVRFQFDQSMDTSSFSLTDDIVSFTGPGGALSPTGYRWIGSDTLEVTIDPQYGQGVYQTVLGPGILGRTGNALDQDGDFVLGETPDDQYTADFDILHVFSGTLPGDTTWNRQYGTIVVSGQLTIPDDVTLHIGPGTVIKFDVGTGFLVRGTLDINGTAAERVVFTSLADDADGGDTNGDGNATTPSAGNWQGLRFARDAMGVLENVDIRYANRAINANSSRANVTLRNAVLSEGHYGVYVYTPYAEVKADNCLITGFSSKGIFVRADSRHVFRNCTIVGNSGGAIHLGGANLTLDNCIVAFNRGGLDHSGDPPALTIRNSIFYNPDGQEIRWDRDPGRPELDKHGNITTDPLFVDREGGNFELSAGSPAIDSGDGRRAPAADILGRARYDDRGMPNVGQSIPRYVDMGAFERQADTPSADLAVTYVASPDPLSVAAGQSVTVEWTVTNNGTLDATGTWQDQAYLSNDPYYGPDDVAFGSPVDHTGPLTPGQSYTASVTATAPDTGGPKYILVQANANAAVAEVFDANNLDVAADVLATDVPVLATGTAETGTATRGQWTYYRYEAQSGRTVLFTLDGQGGVFELYVRRSLPPTVSDYDVADFVPNQSDQEARLLSPAATTYYVGVFARVGTHDYTLTADLTTLDIRDVDPKQVGNAGNVTLKIVGDEFTADSEVHLVAPDGTTFEADEYFQDAATLYATFDLNGDDLDAADDAIAGVYDVAFTIPGVATVTEYDVVDVQLGGAAQFESRLNVPGQARPGRKITLNVEYSNTGIVDITSPLLTLAGSDTYLWRWPGTDEWETADSVRMLAISSEGPADILRPGQVESIDIAMEVPFDSGRVHLTLYTLGASEDGGNMAQVDWSQWESQYRPDPNDVPSDEWNSFLQDAQNVGQSWSVLVHHLAELATEEEPRIHSFDWLWEKQIARVLFGEISIEDAAPNYCSTHGFQRKTITGTLPYRRGQFQLIPLAPQPIPISACDKIGAAARRDLKSWVTYAAPLPDLDTTTPDWGVKYDAGNRDLLACFEAGYLPQFSQPRWIQVVETNSPHTKKSPFLDNAGGNDPFGLDHNSGKCKR